jgi:twitching motility protein PilT
MSIEGVARFRVNVFRHLFGLGAVFRAIPYSAKTIEELGLPAVTSSLCRLPRGLILVTGKTGSGKSTTLAAMLDQISSERRAHIITIEDPIEYIHQRRKSLISQREVGIHTRGFAQALHSALREDPNVIMIGELRDLETISLAVTAAETGILVLSTLHTNNAVATVERVINAFPANRQQQIRAMLSTSLRAVLAQQLVRAADGQSLVAAVEVMVSNPAIANLIREAKVDQLESAIQGGALVGMQTMDGALRKLMEAGRISPMEAHAHAVRQAEFARFLPPQHARSLREGTRTN